MRRREETGLDLGEVEIVSCEPQMKGPVSRVSLRVGTQYGELHLVDVPIWSEKSGGFRCGSISNGRVTVASLSTTLGAKVVETCYDDLVRALEARPAEEGK